MAVREQEPTGDSTINRAQNIVGNVVQAGRIEQLVVQGNSSAVMAVVTRVRAEAAAGEVFVGRDAEMDQMLSILAPDAPGAEQILVSAVAGMGGIGKTALARHITAIAVRRGWFPGGVFWVDLQGYSLGGPVQAEAVFAPLLLHLGVPAEQVPDNAGEQAAVYDQLLGELAAQKRRVLLVFDNAATASQLHGLLPGAGVHRVVVTTRDTLALPRARRLVLDVLTQEAAVALLDEALREQNPDDDRISVDRHAALDLAGVCGWLPLALRIAAALLADTAHLGVPELTVELVAAPIGGFTHGETAIAAVFASSWRHLQARDPHAARLLSLLPLNPGPELATDAAAALAGQAESAVRVHLRTLCQAHLLLEQPGGRWRMHDLIRRYTVAHTTPELDSEEIAAAIQHLMIHYTVTAEAAAAHIDARSDHLVIDRFSHREDALAWLDTEYPSLVAAVYMAAANGDHVHTYHLAGYLSRYQQWRRRLTDHVATARLALIAAEHLDNDTSLAMAFNNLGFALRSVRRTTEAISMLHAAIEIYRKTGDSPREGETSINLGAALCQARRFDEAVAVLRSGCNRLQETGNCRGEGMAWTVLGSALRETKRWEDAIAAHQRAGDLMREAGDRRGEGTSYHNLGMALREVGRWDEAISAHRKAINCFREIDDSYNEGLAWNGLGAVLFSTGRREDAIAVHQKAGDLIKKTGDRHGEGLTSNSLGASLLEAGRTHEAIVNQKAAVARFRETMDPHSEGLAWNGLGVALSEAGEWEDAIAAQVKACELLGETGDDRGAAAAWRQLGFALWETGKSEEAIAAHRRQMEIFRDGKDRHDEGRAWGLLGARLAQLERFEEARECCEHALSAFHETGDRKYVELFERILGDLSF